MFGRGSGARGFVPGLGAVGGERGGRARGGFARGRRGELAFLPGAEQAGEGFHQGGQGQQEAGVQHRTRTTPCGVGRGFRAHLSRHGKGHVGGGVRGLRCG